MIKRKRNELSCAAILFLLLTFPANLSFGQGFGRIQGQGQYNNYNNGMGFGVISPNYGPLTFRYPIENVISNAFPGQFRVYTPYGVIRQNSGISRKSNGGRRAK